MKLVEMGEGDRIPAILYLLAITVDYTPSTSLVFPAVIDRLTQLYPHARHEVPAFRSWIAVTGAIVPEDAQKWRCASEEDTGATTKQ